MVEGGESCYRAGEGDREGGGGGEETRGREQTRRNRGQGGKEDRGDRYIESRWKGRKVTEERKGGR